MRKNGKDGVACLFVFVCLFVCLLLLLFRLVCSVLPPPGVVAVVATATGRVGKRATRNVVVGCTGKSFESKQNEK